MITENSFAIDFLKHISYTLFAGLILKAIPTGKHYIALIYR